MTSKMNQPSRSAPHLHEECISDPRIRIEAGAWVQYRPAILMSSTLEALELCKPPQSALSSETFDAKHSQNVSHTHGAKQFFQPRQPAHPSSKTVFDLCRFRLLTKTETLGWLRLLEAPTPQHHSRPPWSEYLDGELDRQMDR